MRQNGKLLESHSTTVCHSSTITSLTVFAFCRSISSAVVCSRNTEKKRQNIFFAFESESSLIYLVWKMIQVSS